MTQSQCWYCAPSNIRLCCNCRKDYLGATSQCEGLRGIAQHIAFSLGSLCDGGPRILLRGLLDHLSTPAWEEGVQFHLFYCLLTLVLHLLPLWWKLRFTKSSCFFVWRLFAPRWEKCLTTEGHFAAGAATVISPITLQSHFRPQQSISCPCLFFSQLSFSVTALYYHHPHGNHRPEAGVSGFSFFVSEELLSIVSGWWYTPLQGCLLV